MSEKKKIFYKFFKAKYFIAINKNKEYYRLIPILKCRHFSVIYRR